MAKAGHPLLESPKILTNVGAKQARELARLGVKNLAMLATCHGKYSDGPAALEKLRAQARLLMLDGMPVSVTQVLVENGYASVAALARAKLRDLVEKFAHARLRNAPSVYEIAELQQQAWRHESAGVLVLRVLTPRGVALRNVQVRVAGREGKTDRNGWVVLDRVPAGLRRAELIPEGVVAGFGAPCRVTKGEVCGPVTARIPSTRKTLAFFKPRRQSEGGTVTNRGVRAVRIRTVDLAKIKDNAWLTVRPPLHDGRIPLVSLDKTRIGFELFIDRVVVEKKQVPPGAVTGQLLQLKRGRLIQSSLSAADVTRSWIKRRVRRWQVRTLNP